MISQLSDKDFLKELTCLRMQLSPVLVPRAAEILKDVERRLERGSASVEIANAGFKKKRLSNKQEHQQRVNKYYYK